MTERIIELVLDEGKWPAVSMLLAMIAVVVTVRRRLREDAAGRLVILQAMNVFFGWTIGVMSFGHLLAVTVKMFQGTLDGSPWGLYALGFVLVVPSWWLVVLSRRFHSKEERWAKKTLALNAWLGISLLALGPHNAPLALPAVLNIAYQLHSRRAVGWTIVTVMVVANSALFIGSLVFLASGQSFEQFKGM